MTYFTQLFCLSKNLRFREEIQTKSTHLLSLSRWNTNKVWTSYFFQVDHVYKKLKFNVSMYIFSLWWDCTKAPIRCVQSIFGCYGLYGVRLLVINLDLFNFLIDDFELGLKVNAWTQSSFVLKFDSLFS